MTSIYGAGRLDRRARVIRRTAGETAPTGPVLWANVRPTGDSTAAMEGLPVALRQAVVTVRASGATRVIASGDRLEIDGGAYDVTANPLHDRVSGMVALSVTEAVTAPVIARAFSARGRRVSIERTVPNAAPLKIDHVRARITGAVEDEVAGGVNATLRRILVLAEDVPETFGPLRQGDKVLVDGLVWRFLSRPDDQTHRDGEVILAYEGIAAGA